MVREPRVLKRLEGNAKLLGTERYVDDLEVEGCLWGMTVRSPVARGRIREIRFSKEIDWSEFAVVDHRDIPGANEVFLRYGVALIAAGEDGPWRSEQADTGSRRYLAHNGMEGLSQPVP